MFLASLLGTGGTTPLPRLMLGGAYDILTLDRFTFWATILILPFVGLAMNTFLEGPLRPRVTSVVGKLPFRAAVLGGLVLTGASLLVAPVLPLVRPTQPAFVDPLPIVEFLEADEHDRWRYLTLGFGDQFAWLSAQTTALSVDGNYHSARRLPDLTRYSVERLENSKYMGVPGLGSLSQFLVNAESYSLKYVFSNDAFYDPLLWFTGWRPLSRLRNNVLIWERPDMPAVPLLLPRQEIPALHVAMWGILPPLALLLAAALLLRALATAISTRKKQDGTAVLQDPSRIELPNWAQRATVLTFVASAFATGVLVSFYLLTRLQTQDTPGSTVQAYYAALNRRDFPTAYALLDPAVRPSFSDTLFRWRWVGGLLASYGQINKVTVDRMQTDGLTAQGVVSVDWLTALASTVEQQEIQLVNRDARWFIVPSDLRPWQSPERLKRQPVVSWNTVGRRQPLAEPDLYRDRLDRPRIVVADSRLVRYNGQLLVVGRVTNTDADPAQTTIIAEALADGRSQARQTAGKISGHRLRPAESAGFRVTFEQILDLDAAAAEGTFDPTQFLPPEFETTPDTAAIEARAIVVDHGLYRGIQLSEVKAIEQDRSLVVTLLVSNTGTQTANIIGLNFLLFDRAGKAVWADTGFARASLFPGQTTTFAIHLPHRSEIEILSELDPALHLVNGSSQQADMALPEAIHGTMPLRGAAGYGSLLIHTDALTHDPQL